jgi:hypothetical protein
MYGWKGRGVLAVLALGGAVGFGVVYTAKIEPALKAEQMAK